MSYAGLDHWITEGPRMDDDYPIKRELYACDGCGEWVEKDLLWMDDRGWLYCRDCLGRKEDEDPAADKGDWQAHRELDR